MSDIIALIGNPDKLRSRDAIRLSVEYIDDDIRSQDPSLLISDYGRDMYHAINGWVEDHGIRDGIAFGFHTYLKPESLTTAIAWYLSFDSDEHRTLFLLCKDDLLQEVGWA